MTATGASTVDDRGVTLAGADLHSSLGDPLLSAFLYSTILNQESLEDAVIHRLAERLDHQDRRSRERRVRQLRPLAPVRPDVDDPPRAEPHRQAALDGSPSLRSLPEPMPWSSS